MGSQLGPGLAGWLRRGLRQGARAEARARAEAKAMAEARARAEAEGEAMDSHSLQWPWPPMAMGSHCLGLPWPPMAMGGHGSDRIEISPIGEISIGEIPIGEIPTGEIPIGEIPIVLPHTHPHSHCVDGQRRRRYCCGASLISQILLSSYIWHYCIPYSDSNLNRIKIKKSDLGSTLGSTLGLNPRVHF